MNCKYKLKQMSTIFTRIINGEIPCYKIAEDQNNFAFLDINPLVEGHTLVVPKVEQDQLFDLNDAQLADLVLFAKKIAQRIKEKTECKRVAMIVLGLDVPHAHIHLIPMNTMEDVDFKKPKLKLSADEFENIRAKIAIL